MYIQTRIHIYTVHTYIQFHTDMPIHIHSHIHNNTYVQHRHSFIQIYTQTRNYIHKHYIVQYIHSLSYRHRYNIYNHIYALTHIIEKDSFQLHNRLGTVRTWVTGQFVPMSPFWWRHPGLYTVNTAFSVGLSTILSPSSCWSINNTSDHLCLFLL